MATVVLTAQEFIERYPRFAGVFTDGQIKNLISIVNMKVDNTASSPIPFNPEKGKYDREVIMYALMCHLAELSERPSGIAGPVASASEGSVSVSFAIPTDASKAWFNQTQCGQLYLSLIAKYATGPIYYGIKRNHPWG